MKTGQYEEGVTVTYNSGPRPQNFIRANPSPAVAVSTCLLVRVATQHSTWQLSTHRQTPFFTKRKDRSLSLNTQNQLFTSPEKKRVFTWTIFLRLKNNKQICMERNSGLPLYEGCVFLLNEKEQKVPGVRSGVHQKIRSGLRGDFVTKVRVT